MKSLTKLLGLSSLVFATSFLSPSTRAEVSEYSIGRDQEREIIYESRNVSPEEGANQRVISDDNPQENAKLMMGLEPREIWPGSDNVMFYVQREGNKLKISYENLSSKIEMPGRSKVYLFSKDDLQFKGSQTLTVKNGGETRFVPTVPGRETEEFDKATVLANYLERVRGGKSKKLSVYDLGKSVILDSRNVEEKNPFEQLLGEAPGKFGLGLSVTMKANDFLVQRIDGRNREVIATLGENYKITQWKNRYLLW